MYVQGVISLIDRGLRAPTNNAAGPARLHGTALRQLCVLARERSEVVVNQLLTVVGSSLDNSLQVTPSARATVPCQVQLPVSGEQGAVPPSAHTADLRLKCDVAAEHEQLWR